MRVAAGDADWLSETEALLALLGAGVPVSLCAELWRFPGAAEAEAPLASFSPVAALWAEFPEAGAASLFTFEADVPVSFCTGVRGFPEAAGRALEMGALLALSGAVVALWAEFPETGAAVLFAFEAGAPVSRWRLSEDARRGVRSVGAALVLVSASAILEAVGRELEKAAELLRPAAARRADVPGALALRGARAAFALCSACVSAFF